MFFVSEGFFAPRHTYIHFFLLLFTTLCSSFFFPFSQYATLHSFLIFFILFLSSSFLSLFFFFWQNKRKLFLECSCVWGFFFFFYTRAHMSIFSFVHDDPFFLLSCSTSTSGSLLSKNHFWPWLFLFFLFDGFSSVYAWSRALIMEICNPGTCITRHIIVWSLSLCWFSQQVGLKCIFVTIPQRKKEDENTKSRINVLGEVKKCDPSQRNPLTYHSAMFVYLSFPLIHLFYLCSLRPSLYLCVQ